MSEAGHRGWDTRIAVHAAAGLALAGVLLGLLDLPGVTSERHRLGAAVAVVALAASGLLAWAWRAERRRERALEHRLAEDQQRHRAALQHFETAGALSHDILLLIDDQGRVVEANDRAVEAYGWPREALVGRPIRALRAPATAEGVAGQMDQARRQGGLCFETEHVRRDGTTFPVEVSARTLTVGGRTYWQSNVRDITARRRAEAAARLGELKFRTAFQEAGFGVLLLGRDGRIVEHNEAMRRLVDRPGGALDGLVIWDLMHPDDREASRQHFEELMSGRRQVIGGERRYLRPDGTAVPSVLRATAIPDEAGRPAFALGIIEDVSRQRWMEAQLRLSDRMASIGALAAGVAHEINNPLSYIASNVRFALDGTQSGEVVTAEVAEALEEALQGAARVREIVRDLRMLARAEESSDQACDLEGVARTVANMVRHQLRDRATLEVAVPAGLAVAGSAGRVGQVLLNLLINAAQAIEPGQPGRHRVALRARAGCEGRVEVEVEDSGHGIDPAHLPRVFDPFFTTKPAGVGTGLGLSICQGIVASLGGAIQVESEPGRGTTFRLVLPARPGPAPAPGGGAPAVALEVPGAGRLGREAACPAP